jgi:hypothetical protein
MSSGAIAIGRRDAIAAGLAAAVGATALGRGARALAKGDDAARLRRLIEQQQALEVAYRELAAGDALDQEVARAAELFAGQERQHAEALVAAYEDLGEEPPAPPAPAEVEELGGVEAQEEGLELLLAMTNAAIARLNDGAVRFTAPDLVRTAAQIAGNEAQHVVVLRQQLGEDPVPEAFSTGVEE